MESKVQNMGEATSRVFSGEHNSEATKEMYAENSDLFANEIRCRLKDDESYSIADIGSFKGELMRDLLSRLPEYKFRTIAVDINEKALENNTAETKILAPAERLPLRDKSIDVVIIRYVLQWNNINKQKQILLEIARTVKKFGIIEHAGADSINSAEWRSHISQLFSGEQVPRLKRDECFYASKDEIERWMNESGIKFERIRDRLVKNGSDVFIERYALDDNESEKVRNILGNKDFFIQTDWVIYPRN